MFFFVLLGFVSDCVYGNKTKSYSLRDFDGIPLDRKLISKMKMSGGFFIEAGAHDGVTQSNTKLLEENYGWTGILIEPSENTYSLLCLNRPRSICINCALGSFEEDNTYVYGDFDGRLMSSVNGLRSGRTLMVEIKMRSLQSILDEFGVRHVNLFSLDTEGYELNILKGIDFKKTTFDYLLIETYPSEQDEIVSLLSGNGYDMVECFSNYNKESNPLWDGTHNDYLFKKRDDTEHDRKTSVSKLR